MAYVWTEQKLIDSNKRALIKYTLQGDNTSTANSLLMDASMLRFSLNANGYIMQSNTHPKSTYKTTVKRVFGQMSNTAGYSRLQWHINGANTDIVTIGPGSFDYDFTSMGDGAVIPITDSANASGDILYTGVGHAAAYGLTLFLDLRKDSTDYDAGQTADPFAFNKGNRSLT